MTILYQAWVIAFMVVASDATTTIQKPTFRSKNVDKIKLMANAQPKKRDHRDLSNVQLTGRESIVFRSCETLSVDVSVDNANLQDGMMNGNIQGVKSFVEFDVCVSEDCYTGDASARTTYVTSLADYMAAFAEFLPTKQQEYCQGCIDTNDYCQIEYPNYFEQAMQGNRGGRRLAGDKFYEVIDCSRCYSYGCLYTDNEFYNYNQEWTQKHSLEWIQSMASCYRDKENQVIINGVQVSFGFMCNEEGTGVEVAAFMDNDCTLYNNQVAFGNVMSSKDHYMWAQSKANVEYIFNNDFSCYDPDVVYVSPEFNDWDRVQNGNKGDDYVPDAGEWCWNVFGGEMRPTALGDCGANNQYQYGAYNYSLSQEDAQDISVVCARLNATGFGDNIYSHSGSGSMYSYVSSSSRNEYYAGNNEAFEFFEDFNNTYQANNWMNGLDEMTVMYTRSNVSNAVSAWIYVTISFIAIILAFAFSWYKNRKTSFSADKSEPMLADEECSNPNSDASANVDSDSSTGSFDAIIVERRQPVYRPKLIMS